MASADAMIRFAFFILVSIETAATDDVTAPTRGENVSNAWNTERGRSRGHQLVRKKEADEVVSKTYDLHSTGEGGTEENGNRRLVELIKKNLRTNNDDYNDSLPKADSKKKANEISPEKTRRKSAWKEFDQLNAVKIPSTEEKGDLILHSGEKLGDYPNALKNHSAKANKKYIANTTRYPINAKNDEAVLRKHKIKAESKNSNSTDGTVRQVESKGDKRSNAMVLEAYLAKKRLEENLKKVRDAFVAEDESSTEDTSASLHETRDVNALDMAPARGSYITKLRQRGRVCDRNVLKVEGPKYNSKGKPYLKAYRPNGVPFGRTRRPSQVLPRCCNCCKKSVLGCE